MFPMGVTDTQSLGFDPPYTLDVEYYFRAMRYLRALGESIASTYCMLTGRVTVCSLETGGTVVTFGRDQPAEVGRDRHPETFERLDAE